MADDAERPPAVSVLSAPTRVTRRPAAGWLALAGIVLVAFNLRGAIAAVAPLLPDVQSDLAMSRGAAGLLTTIPVLCFGLLSPFAAALGRRIGLEPALLLAMLGIVAGSLIRVLPGASWMIAGTAVVGAAITVGNVLVPSYVKQDFAERQGLVTGLTNAALTGGAALAAAVSAPLAYSAGLGWRDSLLAVGALAAVVAAGVWLPRLRRRRPGPAMPAGATAVHRAALTWYLAVFMGTQALLYYAVLAWLPALLRDGGVSAAGAGWALAVFNLCGIATALFAPWLAARRPDQRALGLLICAGWLAGLVGMLLAPGGYLVWMVLAGLAQGAAISLALVLIVLRARTPQSARDLSGVVQSVGYLLAATGPLLIGVLRDQTGGWTLPLVALVAVAAVMTAAALGAGRDRQV